MNTSVAGLVICHMDLVGYSGLEISHSMAFCLRTLQIACLRHCRIAWASRMRMFAIKVSNQRRPKSPLSSFGSFFCTILRA